MPSLARSRGVLLQCQYTSAYVSIRQHTSAYVSIRQHTSAYVSYSTAGKKPRRFAAISGRSMYLTFRNNAWRRRPCASVLCIQNTNISIIIFAYNAIVILEGCCFTSIEVAVRWRCCSTRIEGCSTRIEGCSTRIEGCSTRIEGCSTRIEGCFTGLLGERYLSDAAPSPSCRDSSQEQDFGAAFRK
jgi:hypothetical protein